MTRKLVGIALLIGCAAIASAQDGQRRAPGPDGQRERGARFMDRIARALDLDDDQRAQAQQIFNELRDEIRAERENAEPGTGAESRRGRRGRGPNPQMMERFAERLTPILTEAQATQFAEMRERFAQRGPGQRRGNPVERMRRGLNQLELDETQRAEIDERLADLEAAMNETRPSRETMQQMREEFRAAREAGDESKLEELREQMRSMRETGRETMEHFIDGLSEVLTEPQLTQFREMQERGRRGGPGARQGRQAGVMDYIRMTRRLDLTTEQQELIRDLERELRVDMRDARRERTNINELTEDYKAAIKQILTDEQWTQLEQMAERGQRGQRGLRDRQERRARQPRDRGA